MRPIGSCAAIAAAVLLLTPVHALANDEPETNGTDQLTPLGLARMVGAPAADSASGLPIDWMEFASVGDQAYFVAEGQRPGELWRTDGTTEGTALVTDRFATKREDPITQLTAVGDELYFAAEDRKHGVELWRTDGTDEGTLLVVDLLPGEGRSDPRNIVPLDDLTLFWAKGPDGLCGLWRTNGTQAGTALVRDVDDFGLQSADSRRCPDPAAAVRLGDDAVLWFDTGRARHVVWRSDGTDEGTTLVRRFPRRSSTHWLVAADGSAYFAADDGEHGRELWRTDGTVEGTQLVADVVPGSGPADPEPVAAVSDTVFFFAKTSGGSRALWRTDGTEVGTAVVRKLKPNWQYDYEAGEDLLYFWADDGRHGSELWRSDGTSEGTRMVRDIAPGRKSAGPLGYGDIATVGDHAFFAAKDGAHGSELWVTDGTADGTRLLADITPGKGGTGPSWITQSGDAVLFSADDGEHGRELWRTDGTPDGTSLVRDIGARMASVGVYDAAAIGDDIALLGDRGGRGAPLRWIDGATGQEQRLVMVPTGEISHHIEALGDKAVFTGGSLRTGIEPWISDGTEAGTQMLRDIARGRVPGVCTGGGCPTYPAGSSPGDFVTLDDVAYFTAHDKKHGRELWRTDGTSAGTRMVRDVRPGKGSGLEGATPTVIGDELYFVADDGRHGLQLWKTDGTEAGTRMVTDIRPGWSAAKWGDAVMAGGLAYFAARRPGEGLELWRSDGTADGTHLVNDIRPGPASSKPDELTAVGDALYFTADDKSHGRELWRTDGSPAGTALVADLAPGAENLLHGELMALGDELFFPVWDGPPELAVPGTLYRTDGTEAGTGPFGPAGDGASPLPSGWSDLPTTVRVGDRLFFAADDVEHGLELWTSDGTPEGTVVVDDLRPGPKGSNPLWLVVADSYLYFTADDGRHGRQVWQLPLAP